MKTTNLVVSVLLFILVSSCSTDNKLTSQEKKDGLVLLFDGKTTDGWHNWNEDVISGWVVEDGCLVGQGLGGDIGGDIISEKEYDNFHLKWEWKLGDHGNSGLMYHVLEDHGSKVCFRNIKIKEL